MRAAIWRTCLSLAVMTSMSACATAPTDPMTACPTLVTYSEREQIDAADEMAALEEGSTIAKFLADYLRLRDQLRKVCI